MKSVRSSLAVVMAIAVVAGSLAGAAYAAEWSKSSLHDIVKAAQDKVKDKGDATLVRVDAVGLKEDGTFDLSQPGATVTVQFKAGGKAWSVSYVPIGQPEPYTSVAESPVPGEPLPADVAKGLKDGAEYAKAAKSAGLSFPANISIYSPEAGKAWAVIADNEGKSVILNPTTGEKIQ